MISVILPVTAEEPALIDTLTAFVAPVAEGVVRDLVIVSAIRSDMVERLADAAGCALLIGEGPRDELIRAAAANVRCEWCLVVEPGLIPSGDWMAESADFMAHANRPNEAGLITLAARRGFRASLRALLINMSPLWTQRAHALHGVISRTAAWRQNKRPALAFTRFTATLLDRRGNTRAR